MDKILINQGQWMGDMAVQYSGDIEDIFDIAKINDKPITDELLPGSYLVSEGISNTRMVEYFLNLKKIPATRGDDQEVRLGGIGYMKIGSTFKVR